jgi:hypothetical protein
VRRPREEEELGQMANTKKIRLIKVY